jgi:hypothetical protein
VDTISRCTLSISPPTTVSTACASFLENYLSYSGCLSAHQNDTDFKSKTWRIYLERTAAMWRTKDEVIKLIDNNGNTVDAFTY